MTTDTATTWFKNREMIRDIPSEAIRDCTVPGQDASGDVAYWVDRLEFDAPEAETREYLDGYGAWDDDDLDDHETNVQRLFWIICGNLHDDPDYPVYLDN